MSGQCSVHGFPNSSTYTTQSALVYNEIIILRYAYTCRLGALGTVDEDLVQVYLLSLNAAIGTLAGLLLAVSHNSGFVMRYYCTGFEKGAKTGFISCAK